MMTNLAPASELADLFIVGDIDTALTLLIRQAADRGYGDDLKYWERAQLARAAARRQHGHPDPAVVALVKAATAVRDALDLIDAGSTDECQALIDGLNVAIAGVIGPARVGTAARAPVAA